MSNIKPLFCVQKNISRFMEGVVCKNTSWKSIICAHNEQHQTFCFVSKKKKKNQSSCKEDSVKYFMESARKKFLRAR